MSSTPVPLTLVVGGTGVTGRRVVDRLVAAGRPVRVGSRSATVPFDWHDARTWPGVLAGVEQTYIAYHPDLALPGAADHVGAFADLAASSGVTRIVLLSGRGEEGTEAAEQRIRQAGTSWTILRSAWFAQDFSEHFLLDPVRAGVVALPAGAVAEPFVDVEDVADVAAVVLTEDGHGGRTYELTGPRLLTFAAAADELSRAAGYPIRYQAVSRAAFAEVATAGGLPADEAGPLAELFSRVLDGRNAHLTGDVERVLGRPPRDFADYAARAAATGVWRRSA